MSVTRTYPFDFSRFGRWAAVIDHDYLIEISWYRRQYAFQSLQPLIKFWNNSGGDDRSQDLRGPRMDHR
ncbi:hypothetical protein HMPREF9946_00462 [Acetobacteraceae bacterium AT-5844]|nr:hypothetical protein HMPREF9946_00462 [Acetobacteraceae bacterium AT-5844]